MTDCRLIFSVNPGRCGSGYLAKVLATVPDVCALHEPYPQFKDVMRPHMHEQVKWVEWWEKVKLPFVTSRAGRTYVETSHLFCQGFVEIACKYTDFTLIALQRPHRQVALSMWRKGEIPGRLALGKEYRLQPDDPGLRLPVSNYSAWTDYQVCYWHTLEIHARMVEYKQLFGDKVVETTLSDITHEVGFMELLDKLDLPRPNRESYDELKNKKINSTNEKGYERWPGGDLARQEEEVIGWQH